MSDEEDFFTDDFFEDGDKPKKKRKADGKKKGNRTELELVKLLIERFGAGFSRSVGSGNRWGQVSYLPKHAQDVFSGDLIVPKLFKWVLECKGGYEGIDLNSVFVRGNSELDTFMDQVTKDAARCGRKPMLCWKRDRKPWLVFVHTKELRGQTFKYRLIYKHWTAVDLKTLLKLPDEFFLKRKRNEYHDMRARKAAKLLAESPGQLDIVFISSPGEKFGVPTSETIPGLARELCEVLFHDINAPRPGYQHVERHHVQKALDFAKGRENLIVSCQMGVSRSSATAYIIAASVVGPEEALKILDKKVHMPNGMVIRHGADILGNPDIVGVVDTWKYQADEEQQNEPWPVLLD